MRRSNTITENDRCAIIFLTFLISLWIITFIALDSLILPEVAAVGTFIMAKYYEFVLEVKKEW